jgi:hypothetical protein
MTATPKQLKQHAEELSRALADAGIGLVQTAIALYHEVAAKGIATRIASGEAPCLTLRWHEDKIEVRCGLDGAGDSAPVMLLAFDFACRRPDPLQ